MPLYDYRCHKCGKTFEVMQKFSDDPLTIHEGCGGEVERLLSVPALQFKGTGWYVTDYAKGGKSPSTGSSSESKPADSKTESKPESKPSASSTPSTEK
jgi:putative FmdB family regulatory protein